MCAHSLIAHDLGLTVQCSTVASSVLVEISSVLLVESVHNLLSPSLPYTSVSSCGLEHSRYILAEENRLRE